MPVRNVLIAMTCLSLVSSAAGQAPVMEPAPVGNGPTVNGPIVGPPPNANFSDAAMEGIAPGVGPAGPPLAPGGAPIPQSWLMSAWDPQPRLELRAEATFLQPRFDFSMPIGNQVQAIHNQLEPVPVSVNASGQYVAGLRLGLEYHMGVFGSLEGVGFFQNGPHQENSPFASQDFPIFLTSPLPNPTVNVTPAVLPPAGTPNTPNAPAGLPTVQAPATPAVQLPGQLRNLPPGFPTVVDDARLFWDFDAVGAEANYLHHYVCVEGPISDLALGVGIRFMGVYERVDVRLIDEVNGLTGRMRVASDNNLVGPQFIGRVRFQIPHLPRLRWTAETKIGLMANTVSNSTRLDANDVNFGADNTGQTQFSPLVEGNFMLDFFVTQHLTVFGGFQMLYMDRVARAGDQLEQDLNVFLTRRKEIGTLFMYGPQAGLLFTY